MEPFIGQIIAFGGTFAPRGWALCDGQLLQIAENQALFSILGTKFGGDGRTTFGLPDLRGRVPVHAGSGPGLIPKSLGEKGGSNTRTLSQSNMPSHSHATTVTNALTAHASNAAGEEEEAGDNALGMATAYASENPTEAMRTGSIGGNVNVTVGSTGTGSPFGNEQPFLVINYIIALQGTFPSR